MKVEKYETSVGGKPLIAEFTDLADQATSSVILRYGNTAVLATVVFSENKREGIDYFPLTVDLEEKFYAAGAILGSRFIRREGRPSEQAILGGRVVDRTIRPLFPQYIRNEVQVIITVLSLEDEDPSTLGINAASLALAVSDIPWRGPASAVRIGMNAEGQFIVNPTYKERNGGSALDLLACGKEGIINMIEVGAVEISEAKLAEALAKASEEIEKIQQFQNDIIGKRGVPKRQIPPPEVPAELSALWSDVIKPTFAEKIFVNEPGKKAITAVKREWMATVAKKLPDVPSGIADHFYEEKVDELVHEQAIEHDKRADGRPMGEVRQLFAQAGGVSPVLHGSGIFYRGQTHVFTALTLGGPGDSQIIDSMEERDTQKRFMHHYNFPPFSVGETGRLGGMNRRMIGHGALAEKAIEQVLPNKEQFPYTIRLVSECMASNGSTSMASVCASTLALMDGGVPIVRPVAGIAMGLMTEQKTESGKQGGGSGYKILTDIQGPEDHHGDMDFKVAGTREGITAIQLDVKVDGVPLSILSEALAQAKTARMHILDVIEKEIASPRPAISPRAPEILTMRIRKDQIGAVIGPGGKVINGIREETGVDDITIEEDGTIFITGRNGSGAKAFAAIEEITHEYKPGERFEGEVTRLMEFGAFVRIGKNTEGLVHVSEIAPFRINKVADVLTEGERVHVIIKEIDEKGRVNLSIKQVDPEFAKRKGIEPSSR